MKKIKILTIFSLVITLSGCPLEGDDGSRGTQGPEGEAGINCWDLNGDRSNDSDEDINNDGQWDAQDCSTQSQISKNQVSQNPDVDLNHQHICEALANLGQYPTGCPSATHTNPTGTLREIGGMLDNGTGQAAYSCDFAPNHGPLSLEKKDGLFYWTLEGGFIANSTVIPLEDELGSNSCFNLCQSDPECIASYAQSRSLPTDIVYDCNIFHNSDTIQPWDTVCGASFVDCGSSQGVLSIAQRWSTICP